MFVLAGCTGAKNAKPATIEEFVGRQNTSAKNYILGLFDEHDIVVISERDHREFTQYELIMDVATDPWFARNVGAVMTEVGSVNIGNRVNEFLMSEGTDSLENCREVTKIFRDATDSPYWHCYSWPWMLTELQKFNRGSAQKVSLWPADCAFDWVQIRTPEQYTHYYGVETANRDSIMAANVIARVERLPKGKALVIMNTSHGFLKDSGHANTGRYLADRYGDRVASVFVMNSPFKPLVQDGRWDSLFVAKGKTDLGFDFAGSPFGEANFDAVQTGGRTDLTYSDVFTGLVFYQPLDRQRLIVGWEGFTTDDFVPELERRMEIFGTSMGMDPAEMKRRLWANNEVEETGPRPATK